MHAFLITALAVGIILKTGLNQNLTLTPPLWAAIEPMTNVSALSVSERETLRYHLENLYNNVDLLIRNQKVDRLDLRKQERDFSELQIYHRIPLKRDLTGLKKELRDSAKASKLRFIQLKKFRYSDPSTSPVPKKVVTGEKPFRFNQDQLLERIYFQIVVSGSEENIKNWTTYWMHSPVRLVELNSNKDRTQTKTSALTPSIHRLKGNTWQISAHAFHFRDVEFPQIIPQQPRQLLPQWAKKNPELFSKNEPLLWSFVTRIEELSPHTKGLYQIRSQFLLNDARLDFFLSKAKAS